MARRRFRTRHAGGVLAAVLAALALAPAAALAGSLYSGPGPRPGPDVLYMPPLQPSQVPQLQNTGVWKAPPILVSGASAYRDGEFLYQDFLYDDHGAAEQPDPTDPRSNGNTFSKPDGTYSYPTSSAYANDAADLVEFRVKPLAAATAFRITLNTMKDPTLIAFSIAIGGNPALPVPFPDGANVSASADMFLTVHPSGSSMVADLVHAGTNLPVSGLAPTVAVDTTRRQIEVDVPHSAWDPGSSTVRLAMGVGLWNKATNAYLLPQPAASATAPGGSGTDPAPAAFFNVAFRGGEPMPEANNPAQTAQTPAYWRDQEQGTELAKHDISGLYANVDFGKLAAGTTDDSQIPTSGPMDRILATHYPVGQGADFSVSCFPQVVNGGTNCPGQYQGQLQPYAIYVPAGGAPPGGYGMTLLLHSLSTNYNQYLDSNNQKQFGDPTYRRAPSIVITPEGRGPDGFYDGYAGADTFEVWADVASRYPLNPDYSVITGYSMGGMGTFKLAEQFPDLFSMAQPTVGYSADNNLVPSLRNIPFLMWNSVVDELVPPASYGPTALKLDSLNYRYELDAFTPSEHVTLSINDQFDQAAQFLDHVLVDRNPPHVTFVVDPTLDYAKYGFVADHAYWLSGLALRSTTPPLNGNAEGTIDVLSHGFGLGDPPMSSTQVGAGTLTGGTIPVLAYSRTWKQPTGAAPHIPVADLLDIHATNVRSVTIDAPRAKVDCAARLNITSDGPLAVTLTGCSAASAAGSSARSCSSSGALTFRLPDVRGSRIVRVSAYVNGRHRLTRRGHDLRRVTLRALPAGRFSVRIVATRSSGARLVLTGRFHGCRSGRLRARSRPHRHAARFTG